MNDDPVVIVGYSRTPMGSFQGVFSPVSATRLASLAIEGALQGAGVDPSSVEQVLMGCVLPAGLGQAPARQASLGAGLGCDVPCTTVNKMCGSGMQAAMLAHDAIAAGSASLVVAGGMESMTNSPYLLEKARQGQRLGHGEIKDHMFLDGLEDAYEPGRLMGSFADDTARHFGFTREQQDDYALESLARASRAVQDGSFAGEINPVTVSARGKSVVVEIDEGPPNAQPDRIPTLKPAFSADGSVTAANSSSISDGAAALLLARRGRADELGLPVLATLRGHAVHAQEPAWFTTAPVQAISRLLERVGWDKGEVGLFEINEAFAVVAMAAMRELDLPHDKVNVHGGACALGHPIGASGARIIVTLLAAMQKYDVKRGVASLCIGGGEATAVAIER